MDKHIRRKAGLSLRTVGKHVRRQHHRSRSSQGPYSSDRAAPLKNVKELMAIPRIIARADTKRQNAGEVLTVRSCQQSRLY